MSREFKLYLQAREGHLKLMPWGSLMEKEVKQILGAAQAGLRVYPVVVVDLKDSTDVKEDTLARLEAGLKRLVEEKRLRLGLEPQKGTLPSPPPLPCRCQDDCRGCACLSSGGLKPQNQARKRLNSRQGNP
jgi:hypothetical protein